MLVTDAFEAPSGMEALAVVGGAPAQDVPHDNGPPDPPPDPPPPPSIAGTAADGAIDAPPLLPMFTLMLKLLLYHDQAGVVAGARVRACVACASGLSAGGTCVVVGCV